MSLVDIVVAVLISLLGLYILRMATGDARDLWRVFTATSLADASPGSYVRVSGATERVEAPVTAPLSGNSCVGYALVTEQRYRARFLMKWHPDYVTRELPTFGLTAAGQSVHVTPRTDDATGATPFDPASPGSRYADVLLSRDVRSKRYEPDDAPPTSVDEAVEEYVGDHPHRYSEYRLDEGDDVLVVGELTNDGGQPRLMNGESGTFLLSEKGYGRTLWTLCSRAGIFLLASLVFLVPGVLYLVVTLG